MSLLNWQLGPEGVLILSDTLCTSLEGEPLKLVPKVAHLPHLDMVMGLTGFHNVFLQWNYLLSQASPGLDIDELDDFAAETLPVIWSSMFPFGATARTTIRHWGWSEKSGRFVGRSFRSVDGFQCEAMPDGFGFSPDPAPGEDPATVATIEDMVRVAVGQQAYGLNPPEGELQTYVGGDLIAHSMARDGEATVVASNKVSRFPHYDAHLSAIREVKTWPES